MGESEDFVRRQFDILDRLTTFKPNFIRRCKCKRPQLKPMRLHFIYRCTFCGGKIDPESQKTRDTSLITTKED